MKYVCTRCGDERIFDDDIHYAGVHKCKNCGDLFVEDTRKDEEE